MSIIDDTLKQMGDGHAASPQNANFAQATGIMPGDIPFGMAQPRRPIALWIATAIAVIGVAVYFYLPSSNTRQPPAAVPKILAEVPPKAPSAPAPPAAAVAPPPATVVARVAAPPAPDTVKPAPAPLVAAAGTPAAATTSKPRIPAAVAPSAVVAVASASDPGNPSRAAPAHEEMPWIDTGLAAANNKDWDVAFDIWEAGVRALPPKRLIVAGYAYATPQDMFAASRPAEPHTMFGVRVQEFGRKLYRLAALPPAGEIEPLLRQLRSSLPYAVMVNSSYLQAKMNGGVPGKSAGNAAGKIGPNAGRKPVTQGDRESGKLASSRPAEVAAVIAAPPRATAKPEPAEKAETTGKTEQVKPAAADDGRMWESRAETIRGRLKAGAYEDVSQHAQSLSRDFPDRWEPWFWYGTAQLVLGQVGEAEIALDRATRANPRISQVWVQRAIASQERNDHAAAVRFLAEARTLAPRSPEIYLNLGYSYEALGMPAEAEKHFRGFLSLTERTSVYEAQRKRIAEKLGQLR